MLRNPRAARDMTKYTVTSTLRSAFFNRLAEGTPILFDGGMGTQLYAHGAPFHRCFDELNLLQPDLVQAIHREYIAAGAEVIETNTFSANRVALAAYGLEKRVRDINFRGVKIAREAREISGESVFLAGSVSSIGQPLAPVGTITPEEARAIFVEQIEALLEAGVDLLVLETFSSPIELRDDARAHRRNATPPASNGRAKGDDRRTARPQPGKSRRAPVEPRSPPS